MSKINAKIRQYGRASLTEAECPPNPFELFKQWLMEAVQLEPYEPNAMTLATVNAKGEPSARIVLLKTITTASLTFFTNYNSAKAVDLASNPHAAAVFWWPVTERQVRVEGLVQKTTAIESDEYFASRSKESKLGALISPQSQIIPDRKMLDQQFAEVEKKYDHLDQIARPNNWGGYSLKPTKFEFWQGGPHRLHDRICYQEDKNNWIIVRLAP